MTIPAETELTAEARKAISDAFDTIEKNLPFLISLTPDERKGRVLMGDRNKPFVERTLEGAHIAPELLPRNIVIANVERQLALYRALSPVVARMTSLAEQIEDTHSQVGSEVYTQALEMYRHFKAAGRTEGLDELIDNMGKRFNGQGRKKKTPPKDE